MAYANHQSTYHHDERAPIRCPLERDNHSTFESRVTLRSHLENSHELLGDALEDVMVVCFNPFAGRAAEDWIPVTSPINDDHHHLFASRGAHSDQLRKKNLHNIVDRAERRRLCDETQHTTTSSSTASTQTPAIVASNLRGFQPATCPTDPSHTHVFKTRSALNDHLRHRRRTTTQQRKQLLDSLVDKDTPVAPRYDDNGELQLMCTVQTSHNQIFKSCKLIKWYPTGKIRSKEINYQKS